MFNPYREIVSGCEFWMIPIEGGPFNMGSPDEMGFGYLETPQHPVLVSDFYLGKYLVTQALWKAVMDNENPSYFQGYDLPVEQVCLEEVKNSFMTALNNLTQDSRPAGYFYRLPTDAEWEYAARGGVYDIEGYKYAGSNQMEDVGWSRDNSDGTTKPIGLKCPNQLGLYDMSGNVSEWCADYFSTSYYKKCKELGLIENPQGPSDEEGGVSRGANFEYPMEYCRVTWRVGAEWDYRGRDIGFRLALARSSNN